MPCKLKDGPDSDSKLNEFAVPRHQYFRRFYSSETITHFAHFDNFFNLQCPCMWTSTVDTSQQQSQIFRINTTIIRFLKFNESGVWVHLTQEHNVRLFVDLSCMIWIIKLKISNHPHDPTIHIHLFYVENKVQVWPTGRALVLNASGPGSNPQFREHSSR